MKIAVYGAGAIGSYFAARLSAFHDVSLIARGAQLEAIRANGIGVETANGGSVFRPQRVTDNPQDVGEADLVLLSVKTWQVPEVAAAMRPLIGRATKVLTLQNGIEAPSQLAEVIGGDHVIAGVCRIVVAISAPGVVRMGGIAPSISAGESTPAMTEAFGAIDVSLKVPDSIDAALWEKLLFIAAASGVGAVARGSIGEIREGPTRELLHSTMNEVAAVAHASGVPVAPDAVDRALAFVDKMPPATTASMQRDIADGKPSELEAIIGAPIRVAEKVSVPVPSLRFLYAALVPQERRARGGGLQPPHGS